MVKKLMEIPQPRPRDRPGAKSAALRKVILMDLEHEIDKRVLRSLM